MCQHVGKRCGVGERRGGMGEGEGERRREASPRVCEVCVRAPRAQLCTHLSINVRYPSFGKLDCATDMNAAAVRRRVAECSTRVNHATESIETVNWQSANMLMILSGKQIEYTSVEARAVWGTKARVGESTRWVPSCGTHAGATTARARAVYNPRASSSPHDRAYSSPAGARRMLPWRRRGSASCTRCRLCSSS